jgi:hypothetical protein
MSTLRRSSTWSTVCLIRFPHRQAHHTDNA